MSFPSPAADHLQERLSLDDLFIEHPLSTFFFKWDSDSMINAFLPPRALLLIDKSLTPVNGDIVVAYVNGEFMVRFLKKNTLKAWLVPANSKYQEIEITEANTIVWGVVTAFCSRIKELRYAGFS